MKLEALPFGVVKIEFPVFLHVLSYLHANDMEMKMHTESNLPNCESLWCSFEIKSLDAEDGDKDDLDSCTCIILALTLMQPLIVPYK